MSTEAQEKYLKELFAAGLLVDCGVPGVYGRSAAFELIISKFDDYITRLGAADAPTVVRFPPLLNRKNFEKSGYLKNMPQLAGTIHSFSGDQKAHFALIHDLETGADYSRLQEMTDVVLTPAGCYPLYPTLAGNHAKQGRIMDVFSYCFRHEPSVDPARMQMFRMREYVRIGQPDAVTQWRSGWLDKGVEMMQGLGLDVHIALANDPFFGRTGKMLASNQREQELKYELVVPITSEQDPTAVLSFNYHQELFGSLYGIQVDGETAHTGCVGFGMERVALALLKTHGLDYTQWPQAVKDKLALTAP
ncbi:MAG TPA: amino acid--[acyl-carrier-protein] ligase [Polyangiales bacterium]|nr:amino acid--[acyl-carrier-protein] ligase [Polyangiales bacterium]